VNRSQLYLNEAVRCAQRLEQVADPKIRVLIEQERRDWIALARSAEPSLALVGAPANLH
jgi:hypothetical protein